MSVFLLMFQLWRVWTLKIIQFHAEGVEETFKSFALELLVIKALSSSNLNDYGTQFLEVLEYIRDNAATVKLIDPANSNNNVSDSIDYVDKFNISNHARSSLLKQYFDDIVW